MLLVGHLDDYLCMALAAFQWAPTLGGECYHSHPQLFEQMLDLFQWAPTLGVNATLSRYKRGACRPDRAFQWAPTLGGECYGLVRLGDRVVVAFPYDPFQWAPTLGGECYVLMPRDTHRKGVKAFQWAPTLGGECYGIVYLITPPLCQGVNALLNISPRF